MLNKGFIQSSKSPYGANLHTVPCPDGQYCWCVDYCRFNAITIKNKTPLPLISKSLVLLGQSRLFTQLDLRFTFNQSPMGHALWEKTAFITRFDLYECLIMPFSLTNALATFVRVIDSALHSLLNVICIVYLNNILIFLPNFFTHVANIRLVLQQLVRHKPVVKAKKCEFLVSATKFLGHTILPKGVSMGPHSGLLSHVLLSANLAKGIVSIPRLCQCIIANTFPDSPPSVAHSMHHSKSRLLIHSVLQLRHSHHFPPTLLHIQLANSCLPL